MLHLLWLQGKGSGVEEWADDGVTEEVGPAEGRKDEDDVAGGVISLQMAEMMNILCWM